MYKNSLLLVFAIAVLFSACMQKKTETTTSSTSEYIQQQIDEIVSRIKEPKIPERTINVLDYASKQELVENIKPALDSAIQHCFTAGGGKVVVPPGNYFSKGPIHLKNYINLHIEEGATITFSQNPEHYLPVVFIRWEGTECYNYSPFIYANNQHDIAVTGKGKFNGNAKGGLYLWRKDKKEKTSLEQLRSMGQNLVPVSERMFGKGHYLRPAFMQFINCKNVLIQNIQIENIPFWAIQPTYCKSVTIRGARVDSRNVTNDGVDPDSSEDVLIEDCWFRTGDDIVAIKSGRDQDGWRVNKPSRNIVIRNCYAELTLHGIAIGSEMSGGVENVYVQNITLKEVDRFALQFKCNKDRGGSVRQVYIDGMKIDTTETAVYFTTDYHGYRGGNAPSIFEEISLNNITCNHARKYGVDIVGLEEHFISKVKFDKVEVKEAVDGNRIEYVEDFTFSNFLINKKVIEKIEDLRWQKP